MPDVQVRGADRPGAAMTGAQRIGVALSGGGYRAAAFAAGVLLYLLDSGHGDRVVAVSSVSGGSITNAYFAHRVLRRDADPAESGWSRAAGLLAFLARRDIISPARMVIFASAVAAPLGVGVALGVRRDHADATAVLMGTGTAIVTWTVVFVALFLQLRRSLELAVQGLLTPPREDLDRHAPAAAIRTVLRYWAMLLTFRLRRALRTVTPRMTRLADVAAAYQPVFCCTDLATGSHFYLSTSFVAGVAPAPQRALASIDLGGTAPTLPIATAVAASAAFPAVFRPTLVKTESLGLPLSSGVVDDHILLADGGLFDNFGASILDAWVNGGIGRSILGDLGPAPDTIIVVESGQPTYRRVHRWSVLSAVFRSLDIVHQANGLARRADVQRLLHTETLGGALVSIADDPYETAEECRDEARRTTVLDWLAASSDRHRLNRAGWRALAQQRSRAVPTNLRKLGSATTAQLVLHGYVAAMARTTVELGWQPPSYDLLPADIAALCERPFVASFAHRLAWVLSGGIGYGEKESAP
ncbi:patatin-like phospholipase family protein [Nocardia brasiliensis]|uniref:patatin-like phospholipase family protein n=1 Tax=Nocardia brasiliensis TaxID=37326 RepID=UPI0024563C21|nr:patatin-like phospholipase family protein [Nocardia brasiliensis]